VCALCGRFTLAPALACATVTLTLAASGAAHVLPIPGASMRNKPSPADPARSLAAHVVFRNKSENRTARTRSGQRWVISDEWRRVNSGERRRRREPPPNEGLVDWLLACPEKGFCVPLESESTDSL